MNSAQHPLGRRLLSAVVAASLAFVGLVGVSAPAYADEPTTEPGVVEVVESTAPPVEEVAPAVEAPAEVAPSEEVPAEEAPADEAPALEVPTVEIPAEDAPAELTVIEEPQNLSSLFAVASYGASVSPSEDLTDGATVTISATLPATITGTAGTPLTTGVYVMYCAEPAGAVGTAGGRATGAACDATAQQYLVASAGPAGGTVAGSVTGDVWNFSTDLVVSDSFGANECLAAASDGVQCGVFIRLYHGFNAGNVANPYLYDQFVPVTFEAPFVAPATGITVSPTTDLTDGASVTVSGTFPATITGSAGTPLTAGVYVMYCAEPAGAVGTAGGRATGAACDASVQQYLVASAGPAGGTVAGSIDHGYWSFSTPVTVADSFGVNECLAATDDAEQCGIFVRLYHGFNAGNMANPYLYDQFVPVTFEEPFVAPATGITVTPTEGLADGDTVTVEGTFPATITGTAGTPLTTGVYLMFCTEPAGTVGTAGGRATGAACDASVQQYLVASTGPAGGTVAGSIENGYWSFSTELNVPDSIGAAECLATTDDAAQCGIFIRLYHGFNAGNVANPYLYDQFVPVTFAEPAPAPVLTLSQSTGIDPAGETITVSGSNLAGPDLYVQVGWIKDNWAPSTGGVNNTDRKGTAAQVIGSASYADAPLTDGAFSTEFTITKAQLDAIKLDGGRLVFYTVGAGGVVNAQNEAYAEFTFATPTPAPVLTLSKSTELNPTGETITVSGSNLAGPDLYLQVGWIKPATWAPSSGGVNGTDRKGTGAVVVGSAVYASVPLADGSFETEFTITKAQLDAIALSGGQLAFFTVGAGGDVSAANEAYATFSFATPTTPTNPTNPTNPTQPAGPSLSVSPGSVDRTVANTFTISGSGFTGAGAANGVYVNIGSSSVWQPGQVPSQGGWLVSGWVTPASIVNGSFSTTLTVPANAFVAGQSYGVATFAAHGLSVTNRTLDKWAPISLGGASGTTTTAAVTNTPAAAPPATTGVTTTGEPQAGASFTAEASGYQPNEAGILVVIYSTPQVLGTVTADAAGVAKWTGILPAALTGKHTLTFQGSVDKGIELDIAAADVIGCPVDDAALTWGFKESFRSYISGSIANGEWTVANGATYETPSFGFSSGTGGYDGETAEGLIGFLGSITFTGHGGVLNTTVSNPQIRFVDAETAILLLDISGTTQEGTPVTATSVEFGSLDISGASVTDGVWSVQDAPATLTADGAADFGTYPEGEVLDPVSLTFTIDPDCATAGVSDPTATAQPEVDTTSSTAGLGWIWWVLIALAIAAIVVVVVLMARRRRSAE